MTKTDNIAVTQAVHDLGAALWFGGSVAGVAGFNKAGNDLADPLDRIRVANSAWRRFGPVEWAGLAANAVTGLQLTRANRGRVALQQGYGRAGAVKAGLTAVGALATAYAAYTGSRIGKLEQQARQQGRSFDVKDASQPSEQTPPEVAKWQKRQRVAQYLVPTISGGNVVLGSYLTRAYRPGATARGVVRRLLPGG